MTELMTESLSFVLASLISGYPAEDFHQNLANLMERQEVDALLDQTVKNSWARLKPHLHQLVGQPGTIDDRRSEYIDIFERSRAANSLYETEYGRERILGKPKELADIAGFYRAFGMELGQTGSALEMPDHVSVELEFYALLLMKQALLQQQQDAEGGEIVLDARKKFLHEHLGRFVSAIAQRPEVVSSEFYSAVFQFCRDWVAETCTRLAVQSDPLTGVAGTPEAAEEIRCGLGCLPRKQQNPVG